MARLFFVVAMLLAATAVVFGAFGAHALSARLDARGVGVFETANRYHFYHALGLALVAFAAMNRGGGRLLAASGWLMIAGILLFSGSLYLLALTGAGWLGAVTPFGGAAFIFAWLLLAGWAWVDGGWRGSGE